MSATGAIRPTAGSIDERFDDRSTGPARSPMPAYDDDRS